MKRIVWLAGLLCVLVGIHVISGDAGPCRSIDLSDIDWLASINEDENADTPGNHAVIIQGTDEHRGYYGMEWSSPEFTDLSLNGLDRLDREGVESIRLILAIREPMEVEVWAVVDSGYCSPHWGAGASSQVLEVGTEPVEFLIPASSFDHHPFESCEQVMTSEDLQSLGSIILLPEAASGELRVYALTLCGEGFEASSGETGGDRLVSAVEAPCCDCESGSPSITLSPDRTEIRPGETITWTVEVRGMQLPFNVALDIDNDGIPESSLTLTTCMNSFPTTYTEANVHAPYLVYSEPETRKEIVVHSNSIIGVLPQLEPREGVGMQLPTPANPTGDYIKGLHVFTIDQALFDEHSGRTYVQSELRRISRLGVNLVVFNINWYVRETHSSHIEPHYGIVQPWHWQSTLTVRNLVDLIDWTHQLGMRAGFRFLNTPAGNYDGTGNFERNPEDPEKHARLQAEKHGFYASLAAQLGVEFYDLGGEDNLMTQSHWGSDVANAARLHYDGYLTISPTSSAGTLYKCPFLFELDLLGHTEYVMHGLVDNGIEDPHTIREAALTHFRNGLEVFLLEKGKAGVLAEQGASIRDLGPRAAASLTESILVTLSELAEAQSPIIGTIWWIWNIRREGNLEPHAIRSTPSEDVVREYYSKILPDRITVEFDKTTIERSTCVRAIQTFDGGIPELELWQSGGTTSAEISATGYVPGSRSLLLIQVPDDSSSDVRFGFVWHVFESPRDWREFEGLALSLMSSNENWGVEVNLVDADGDRFNTRVYAVPWFDEWVRVTLPFSAFVNPAWAVNREGDQHLDLTRITKWGIGIVYADHGPQSIYVDDMCLYR